MFWLKLLAMLTMLVDHIGVIFFNYAQYRYLRLIGRLAFPLFCFGVAEGLAHTRDRKKYAIRLAIFALISEIPYDIGFKGTLFYFEDQNVMFVFLMAVLGIWIYEQPGLISGWIRKLEKNNATYAYQYADEVVRMFVLAACAGLAYVMKADYGAMGVLLVYCMYFSRKCNRWVRTGISAVAAFLLVGVAFGLSNGYLLYNTQNGLCAAAGMLFVGLYNGKRGPNMKWLFYVFYPAHLLILRLIALYREPLTAWLASLNL